MVRTCTAAAFHIAATSRTSFVAAAAAADASATDADVHNAVVVHTGLRSFARDGRLRCHRSAIPRG
jgi:hypothetical protein